MVVGIHLCVQTSNINQDDALRTINFQSELKSESLLCYYYELQTQAIISCQDKKKISHKSRSNTED